MRQCPLILPAFADGVPPQRPPVHVLLPVRAINRMRAEVILAGACIVRTVMDLLGHDHLTVSDRGLRHGVLIERFGSEWT